MISLMAATTADIREELTGKPDRILQSPGEVLLFVAALAAVALAAFLIAYWCHQRNRRPKRKRRARRPRRPTLAETGGLPPVRDEYNPPPE